MIPDGDTASPKTPNPKSQPAHAPENFTPHPASPPQASELEVIDMTSDKGTNSDPSASPPASASLPLKQELSPTPQKDSRASPTAEASKASGVAVSHTCQPAGTAQSVPVPTDSAVAQVQGSSSKDGFQDLLERLSPTVSAKNEDNEADGAGPESTEETEVFTMALAS